MGSFHELSIAIFQFAFCVKTRGYTIIYPIKSHWITIIYPIKTPCFVCKTRGFYHPKQWDSPFSDIPGDDPLPRIWTKRRSHGMIRKHQQKMIILGTLIIQKSEIFCSWVYFVYYWSDWVRIFHQRSLNPNSIIVTSGEVVIFNSDNPISSPFILIQHVCCLQQHFLLEQTISVDETTTIVGPITIFHG